MLLSLKKSFFGKEDHNLADRLLKELPGILGWSLKGLERLQKRDRFETPGSSREVVQELENLTSPIGAFVRDRCSVGPGQMVDLDALYLSWHGWCREQGRDPKRTSTKQTFGRDLRAAVPGISARQRRDGSRRVRCYEGIGLTGK